MVNTLENPRRLSNAQAVLLQLFETDLPEEDLKEVKNLLTRFLFKKAEKEADKAMKAKGMTLVKMEKEIEKLNNSSRTDFLKNLKANHEGSH
jgi:predicted transcriptional regulator